MADQPISTLSDGGDITDTDEFVIARSGANNKILGDRFIKYGTDNILTAADGSLLIKDAAVPIGSELFEITDNGYGTTFLSVDSSNTYVQKLAVGENEVTLPINGVTYGADCSVHQTGTSNLAGFVIERHVSTGVVGAQFIGARSGGTHASPVLVNPNDTLVRFSAMGWDGTDYKQAADITVEVDGTPGSADMPGRIVFYTTPDGTVTPQEAMRISQDKSITALGPIHAKDTSTPSGLDLFKVTDNAGTTKFLNVDANGADVTGTLRVQSPALGVNFYHDFTNFRFDIDTGSFRFNEYLYNHGIIFTSNPGVTDWGSVEPNSTYAQMVLSSDDTCGNQFIFTNWANRGKDHDHVPQTDPTVFIHSDTDPDTNNAQWISFYHDKTHGQIQTGTGDINFTPASGIVDIQGSLNVTDASTTRVNLGLVIGSDVQAYDNALNSIAGLTTAADKMIYTTASDTYAVTDLTSLARTFLANSTAITMANDLEDGLAASVTTGATETIDFNSTRFRIDTLDADCAFSVSNVPTGSNARVVRQLLIQDGSGSHDPSWTGVTWATGAEPTLDTTPGAIHYIEYWAFNSAVYGFAQRVGTESLETGPITINGTIDSATEITSAGSGTRQIIPFEGTTTNASATTIYTLTIPSSTTLGFVLHLSARRTGGSAGTAEDGAHYVRSGAYKNVGGTATIIGSITNVSTQEDQAAWDVTFNATSNTVQVQVTGALNNNVSWSGTIEINSISAVS